MYTNQEILRLSTSQKISSYNKGINFMLLPMRIETKIMNKSIQKCHDVDKAFFLFKSIWEIVLIFQGEKKNISIEKELDTLEYVVGNVEILYKEDHALLVSLLDRICCHSCINELTKSRVNTIKKSINDKTVMNAVKDNRATELIKRYKRALSQLKRTKDEYKAISKVDVKSDLLKTVKGRYTYVRTVNKWIESERKSEDLLASSDKLLNEIPSINITQKNTLCLLLKNIRDILLENDYESIEFFKNFGDKAPASYYYCGTKETFKEYINNVILRRQIDTLQRYIHQVKDIKKTILAKKEVDSHRYTQLAYMLTIWALGDRKYYKKRHDSIVRMAYNTLFNFEQEQMWVKELLSFYNTKVGKNKVPIEAIKSNNRYIKKRKMITYTKERCLCIRIYPDELAVSQLRRELTTKEISDASLFLRDYFRSASDSGVTNPKQEAWDRLCKLYPPYRAAWIVRSTVQNKLWCDNSDNSNFISLDVPFVVPISQYLPERFFVQASLKTGRSRECMLRRYGRRIPDELQVGINLNQGRNFDPDKMAVLEKDYNRQERLQLSDNLRWMTDYNEAERKGMAISIPLSAFKYSKNDEKNKEERVKFKFTSIYVMGVKTNIDVYRREGSEMLCHLMDAQMFSEEGMDIVKCATPTNILNDSTEIPFDTSEATQSVIFFNMLNSCLRLGKQNMYVWESPDFEDSSDVYMLAKLFDYKKRAYNPLREITNSSQIDLQKARSANEILLEELCGRLEPDATKRSVLTYINTHPEVKKYFINYVTARSFYPTIRMGSQPYGILPVSDIKHLKLRGDMGRVKRVLLCLTEHWNMIARQNQVTNDTRDSREFIELMGKTPISSSYFEQYAVSADNLLNPLTIRGGGFYKTLSKEMAIYLSKNLDEAAHVSHKLLYIPIADEDLKSDITDDNNPLYELAVTLQTKLQKKKIIVDQTEARRLVSEFFDLFTYRLDAWTQGLLFYQINEFPREQRLGVGAYGWVFDLDIDLSKENTDYIGEYLLAPSINQAITAGILRGAYNNSISKGSFDETMNINLSSERVRKAKRIIEGLRNGLALGTILGADGERLLHDSYKTDNVEMDIFIYPLRQRFPMYVDNKDDNRTSATISTFNGAQLIQELRTLINKPENIQNLQQYFSSNNSNYNIFKNWVNNLPSSNTQYSNKQYDKLLEIFQQIYDSYDALTDIMLSEGVYQLSMGNTDHATAIMNALDNAAIPPIPQFTEIPIAHARIENRVMAFLEPIEAIYNNNHALQNGGEFMSLIDSSLDKWIASILGSELKMYRVGISPSEIVYLSTDSDTFRKFLGYLSSDEYPAETLIEEFDSLEFIAETVRNILGHCYSVKAEDLVFGQYLGDDTFDNKEIESHYKLLRANIDNVKSFFNTISSEEDILPMLWVAFRLGINRAVANYDAENPKESINIVMSQLDEKIKKADNIVDEAKQSDSITFDTYLQAIRSLTIGNAVVVKEVSIDPRYMDLNNFKQQIETPFFDNLNRDRYALDEWLSQMADIRPALNELQLLRMYGQLQGQPIQPKFTAMQLPMALDENEQILTQQEWLGIEVSNEKYVNSSNVYLAMGADNFVKAINNIQNENICKIKGLMIDFWSEKIPLKQQTAGLTFNFNQPDAEAPQAILMALPTSSMKNACWSINQLERSIKCALHLVKNRAVEPDHLQNDIWGNAIFPLLNPLNQNKVNSK